MCLILFGFRAHRHFPLVVAANRDEHHARPAAAAAFWDDHPEVYGGRDLEKGGTWMGLRSDGRFSAITNFREGRPAAEAPRSRGELVRDFLTGDGDPVDYLSAVAARGSEYNPYCLLAGSPGSLHFLSNRSPGVQPVAPGIHGLSNHLLDTPWPKVLAGKQALAATTGLDDPDAIAGLLFACLADRSPAADGTLPDTGISPQRERELSPPFICGTHYGTRTSTLILVHRSGDVFFHEKRFGPDGAPLGEDARGFRLQAPAPPRD